MGGSFARSIEGVARFACSAVSWKGSLCSCARSEPAEAENSGVTRR